MSFNTPTVKLHSLSQYDLLDCKPVIFVWQNDMLVNVIDTDEEPEFYGVEWYKYNKHG